ncbi:hypothetical protein ACFO5T_12630 [Dokdonia genika]|uniref:Uncharacterized protein n=1 Tax=Dokdonia genika TaxID=308113 RepID=A0ABV9LC85_9FLAO
MKSNNKFQHIENQYKDHHIDHKLTNVFEIAIPFWKCIKNIVGEKETEIDRFSKIILESIEAGIKSHQEICAFLGIKETSFVTVQFHFLIKNGMIVEKVNDNLLSYTLTKDGIAFLKKKKKIRELEIVPFEFYYNDLLKSFFTSKINIDQQEKSNTKKVSHANYILKETRRLTNTKIKHQNKPNNLDSLELATYFNRETKNLTYFDQASTSIKTHRRSILFLAIEYTNALGAQRYDIRKYKKTVEKFDTYQLEEKLSKAVTQYSLKNPFSI